MVKLLHPCVDTLLIFYVKPVGTRANVKQQYKTNHNLFFKIYQILDENVLWVEKVPPDVRANIIASADVNGDGYITEGDHDLKLHLNRTPDVSTIPTFKFGKTLIF